METSFDLVIIGAGFSGLSAAKTFLECEPDVNLRIFDSNASIGGVWAEENLYSGLKTNNLRGTLDFTDFPMGDDFGVRSGEHIPGEVMHQYLTAYAKKWDLPKRISLRTTVTVVEKAEDNQGGYWRLIMRRPTSNLGDSPTEFAVTTKKLIVSTGITNNPHQPNFDGVEQFGAPIVHSAALGREQGRLFKNSDIRTVAILGGGKSAYDAVYMAACEGRTVVWLMRRSGRGPAWIFPPHTNIGPFKAWREKLVTRRVVSFFSPCIWGAVDGFGWVRRILHATRLGKLLSQKFWVNLHQSTLDECGYAKDERLRLLEPETSPFWYGTASGTNSYPRDLYGFIRSGQVQVHREDIHHLSRQTIHLADGKFFPVHALINATGYSPSTTIQFLPTRLHSDLGIPTRSMTPEQTQMWANLDAKADSAIRAEFPRLLSGPFKSPSSNVVQPYVKAVDRELQYTPFRLYRSIAPPGLTAKGDNNIAFIGYVSNIASTIRLEIQCLWAYAYLSGKLDIDRSKVMDDAALMSRFHKHRSPYGHGRFFPDLVFDQNPFFDLLLKDLGLRTWRKANLLRELFEPYGQDDYRGLAQEWLQQQQQQRRVQE